MERQCNWVIKKVCNWVIRLGWNKNWTGTTEVKWANTSWKELRWEERDERKVEEWCQNPGKEQRSSGKTMEVCCSSYRQNLFLDPIAVRFSNLETSATRLARALLVSYRGNYINEAGLWKPFLVNVELISFCICHMAYFDGATWGRWIWAPSRWRRSGHGTAWVFGSSPWSSWPGGGLEAWKGRRYHSKEIWGHLLKSYPTCR